MNANDQKRIEKSSLYFQVGLTLSLILAYLFIEIEFQTVTKDAVISNKEVDISEVYTQKFIIEKPKVVEPIVEKSKPKFVNTVKPVEQTKPDEKEPIETTTPATEPTIDKPVEPVESAPLPTPTKPDVFERGMVEESPTFMICAKLKGIERDKCFNEQLKKVSFK
ncbi:hypothetical protein [Flavobacterium orientale]|uniref:Energy transducer TonB n=1 Tax=Flavobacterium orientale TaxID=1756020 RepID=A0A916Y760_9FLAO|nr:hypothetical protein [Flavobacterium orientale]GGD33724.1 hypothetical protein GCM10011343_24620 [Flavobacterium orientale]